MSRPWLPGGPVLLIVLAGLSAACRQPAPPQPPAPAAGAAGAGAGAAVGTGMAGRSGGATGNPALEVNAASKLLYTYLGSEGRFQTVAKIDEVPAEARAMVRVSDPARAPAPAADLAMIWVADLRQPDSKGRYPSQPMSRDAFERATLGEPRPGEGSAFQLPGLDEAGGGRVAQGAAPPGLPSAGAPLGPGPGAGAGSGTGAATGAGAGPGAADDVPPNTGQVILYSAAWCGYCRAAREFLASRRVPFVEKDVEKDPRAAAELAHKARRAGIHPSRIPIIDVRGRLVEGFDPVRLATLLGETT